MNKNLSYINFILISLLPIAFIAGPLIVEIIVLILIFTLIHYTFKEKDFFYFKNKIFLSFIIFYLFLLLSLFFSKYFKETSINIIFYFRFLLFSLAISLVLNYDNSYLKKIYIFFFPNNFDCSI